ncbi:MAG: redoxin domain-containing protein [Candidatus Thorarchaeota archaeon]
MNIDEEAPEFSLPNQDGNHVRLSDFRGSNALLVFHPGRLDRVCKEYLSFFSDYRDSLRLLGTEILAINMESVETNRNWISEENLGFDVLSDQFPLGGVTLKYDCYVPKEGYGKRVIFLINKDGRIKHIEAVGTEEGACPNMSRILAAVSDS